MGIMLRLRNIKVSGNIVEAEYSPESSGVWGHISVDVNNEEIIHSEEVSGYSEFYRWHAFWKLIDIVKSHSDVKECIVMWY